MIEKVWYTGSWDKETDKSEVFFHVLQEFPDGSTKKYKFKGIIQ